MDINRSVTTNVSRLTLEHLLKQKGTETLLLDFLLYSVSYSTAQETKTSLLLFLIFFNYQRTYLGYRPVNLEGL